MPPAGFNSPTIRAAVARTTKSGSLSSARATVASSGALRRARAFSTDGTTRRSSSRSIERVRSSATLGGSVPSTSASAARTVHCESGSMLDSTSTKFSGSIAAAACSAAARIAGHGSLRRSCTTGRPSGTLSVPSAVTAWRRTFGSAASEASFASTPAARFSPIVPSARIADTATSRGVPAALASVMSGLTAAPSFSTPSPRAANACEYLPGPFSIRRSAGAARLSSIRPSAYATGHQLTVGSPLASRTALASGSYVPSRTSAYTPSRKASASAGAGHRSSSGPIDAMMGPRAYSATMRLIASPAARRSSGLI